MIVKALFVLKLSAAFLFAASAFAADAAMSARDDFLEPTPSSLAPVECTIDPARKSSLANPANWEKELSNTVAQARAEGRSVVVNLAPGDYVLRYQFTLAESLSGAPGCPVVFRGPADGSARILGAPIINPGQLVGITSADSNYRRFPVAVRDSIRKVSVADSAAYSIHDNVYKTTGNANVLPTHEALFLGGRFQNLARWPNRDADGGYGWGHFPSVASVSGSRAVCVLPEEGRYSIWKDLANPTNGVQFHTALPFTWNDEFHLVKSFDLANRRVSFVREFSQGQHIKVGIDNQCQRFVAVNVAEELDAPGEWWLDHASKTLYYYPESSAPDGTEELAFVSYKDMLVRCCKVRNDSAQTPYDFAHDIRFENVTFAYQNKIGTFYPQNARIGFENCRFHSFLRETEVKGTDIVFRDCTFEHFGGSVLSLRGGDEIAFGRSGIRVEGCTFRDFQHIRHTEAPAVIAWQNGVAVRDCEFSDSPHYGLAVRGVNGFFGWNRFHDLNGEMVDCGCIYTGHRCNWQGNVIAGCRMDGCRPTVTDIKNLSAEYRSCGVYLDDSVWGVTVIGCDITGTRMGLFLRSGNLHNVMWNRFTDVDRIFTVDLCPDRLYPAGITDENWNSANSNNWFMTPFYEKKRGDGTPAGLYWNDPLWRAAFPRLGPTIEDVAYRAIPWNNRFEGNLFTGCNVDWVDHPVQDSKKQRLMTWRNNLLAASPKIADHVGFARQAGSATDSDLPGFAAARARLAALKASEPVDVTSPGGRVRARFGLDATARLCVRIERDGRDLLWPSAMGATFDGVDYGRLVIPGEPVLEPADKGKSVRVTFPLETLADGPGDVSVEALVSDERVSYRFVASENRLRTFSGEVFDWTLAEGVAPDAAVCSTHLAETGTYFGAFRTPWRTCRFGTVVQLPDGTGAKLLTDDTALRPVFTDDPALTATYTAGTTPGVYMVLYKLASGYTWSNGNSAFVPRFFQYEFGPSLEGMPDGWYGLDGEARYFRGGVPHWRMEAICKVDETRFRQLNADAGGALDLWGIERALSALGIGFVPDATLAFGSDSGANGFANVTALVISNRHFAANYPAGSLKPLAGISHLVLGDEETDLTVGSKDVSDQVVLAKNSVFGASFDALESVEIRGRDVRLRNAFCCYVSPATARLADVRVRAAGNLDLGWNSFNVSTGSKGGTISNAVFEAGGDLHLGGRALRYSLVSNALVSVSAPPGAQVVLDGPHFIGQYSTKMPVILDWYAPPPVLEDPSALCDSTITWRFPAERAEEYAGIFQGTGRPVTISDPGCCLSVALPPAESADSTADRRDKYGSWQQIKTAGTSANNGGGGTAYWHRFARIEPGESPTLCPGLGKSSFAFRAETMTEMDAALRSVRIETPDPDIVSGADYASYFTFRTEPLGDNRYLLAAELDPDAVEVESVVAQLAAQLPCETAELTGCPGLWYSVEQSERLEDLGKSISISARAERDGTLSLALTPFRNSAFYRLHVMATEFKCD